MRTYFRPAIASVRLFLGWVIAAFKICESSLTSINPRSRVFGNAFLHSRVVNYVLFHSTTVKIKMEHNPVNLFFFLHV